MAARSKIVTAEAAAELIRDGVTVGVEGAGRLLSPHHKNGKGASIRLGDVLRALRSGQEIVEIEDEEATVRIWVE